MKSEGTPLNSFYNQRKRLKSEKEIPDSIPVLETDKMDVTSESAPTEEPEEDVSSKPNKRKSNKRNKSRKNKKLRKSKTESQELESFNLNQTLDISSDESD